MCEVKEEYRFTPQTGWWVIRHVTHDSECEWPMREADIREALVDFLQPTPAEMRPDPLDYPRYFKPRPR